MSGHRAVKICGVRMGVLSLCLLAPGALLAQLGEYEGPSMLSRGTGGMGPSAPITFRPFVNLSAIYNSDGRMSGSSGEMAGGEAAVGLYGYHTAKRTIIGINYRGSYRQYTRRSLNEGSEQFLTLGLVHRFNRKMAVTLREGAGTFTRNTGHLGTFGFYDPTFAQIPMNELLDSRTDYFTTMGDLTYQHTPRLSFNMGGSGFLVRRRVSSLYGVTGASARGDVAYRMTRRTTVGLDYFYTRFDYNKAFGSADLHSVAADYSVQFSRRWRLSARAGMIRVETLSLGTVQLDPAIAALLGVQRGLRAFYRLMYDPTVTLQVASRFRHGEADITGSYGASPGNGIYLASRQSTLRTSYNYTGMRHWSLQAHAYYSDMRSVGQDIGRYEVVAAGLGLTRTLRRHNLFATCRYDIRRYLGGVDYRRFFNYASIGIAYSPGERPLRLW